MAAIDTRLISALEKLSSQKALTRLGMGTYTADNNRRLDLNKHGGSEEAACVCTETVDKHAVSALRAVKRDPLSSAFYSIAEHQ